MDVIHSRGDYRIIPTYEYVGTYLHNKKKQKKNSGIELADGRVIRFGEINSSTSLLSLVELLHEILEEERRIQIGYNVGRIANAAFNNI